jgi:drug/metabolite transporter (DMT)-like permease
MPSAGILLALISAIVWGTGDFVGGAAVRRSSQFQVLALSALSGVVLLVIFALVRETIPPPSSVVWAGVAGLATAVGIASLYQGLALGGAAIVAPIAAVVTAAIPAIFTAFAVGLPRQAQSLGFAAAGVGIWLVTRVTANARPSWTSVKLGLLAGMGFGAFLTLIAQVGEGLVFAPLVVARTVTLVMALVLLRLRGISLPTPASNPLALLAGVLDAGGNVFFVLAQQHTRLDIAAVLSSLYPVATVGLARLIWREPVTSSQWAGIFVCLISVALMAE